MFIGQRNKSVTAIHRLTGPHRPEAFSLHLTLEETIMVNGVIPADMKT